VRAGSNGMAENPAVLKQRVHVSPSKHMKNAEEEPREGANSTHR